MSSIKEGVTSLTGHSFPCGHREGEDKGKTLEDALEDKEDTRSILIYVPFVLQTGKVTLAYSS